MVALNVLARARVARGGDGLCLWTAITRLWSRASPAAAWVGEGMLDRLAL